MASAARKLDDIGIESFADELKPGTKLLFGQFVIESFLNAGGFGITYIARDSLDRRVVIKECFPSAYCRRSDTTVAPRSRQRQEEFRSTVALFQQEALNLSKLNHPNIVKVHQVFQDNDTAYMAMDLVDGPDLLETIEGTAPRLSPDQITLALTRMLDALGYVHAQGFLHRDISPDNILLDRTRGEPVLIDFGAARKDVTRKSRALSGLRVVKDGYSPQEFYISGSKQGPCSDLYALAATFCHLISDEVPKTSQERLSAIANRLGDPQRPLVGRVKGYPTAFLAAIDKAMSIFPKDRLHSAAEWQAMMRGTALPDAAPVGQVPPPSAPVAAAAIPSTPIPSAPIVVQPAPQPAAVVMRPRGALLRAVMVPAVAAALLVAGVLSVPGDLWQRIGLNAAAPGLILAAGTPATDHPYAVQRAVRMPFLADPADPAQVAARLPWSPDWVQPGQRIVEVNGTPVQNGASLPQLMAAGVDLTDMAELNVIFGYEGQPGGDIVHKMVNLQVVDQVRLDDGLVFDIESSPNGTRTMVTAVPNGADSVADGSLQVGDVLLTYAATGETLGNDTAFRDLLQRETAKNVATYGFAVQRDGGVAVGSFTLPGTD